MTLETVAPPDDRLAQLAAVANAAHSDTIRSAVTAGQALIEAKKLVGHGGWSGWVDEHCRFSDRTASAYMRLARQRAADLGFESIRQVLRALATPKAPPHLDLQAQSQLEQPVLPDYVLYTEPVMRDWCRLLRSMPRQQVERSRNALLELRTAIDEVLEVM